MESKTPFGLNGHMEIRGSIKDSCCVPVFVVYSPWFHKKGRQRETTNNIKSWSVTNLDI